MSDRPRSEHKSKRPSELSRPSAKEWRIEKLKSVAAENEASFVDGPFGSNLKASEFVEDGHARIVQLQNIDEGRFVDINHKYIDKEKFQELERHGARPGDISIAKMAEPVARACILPDIENQYVVVADCIKLEVGQDFNSAYVMYALNSRAVWSQAYARSRGSTRKRINLTQLKEVEIPAPPLAEQRKIASVLYTIDEILENTEDYIRRTKRAKKGVSQKIMREGFHDHEVTDSEIGRIPSAWSVRMLEDVCNINPEGFAAEECQGEKFQYIELSSVSEGAIGKTPQIPVDEAPSRARRRVRYGDVLIGTVRPKQMSHAFVSEKHDGKVCSTGFAVARTGEDLRADYLAQEIFCHRFFRQMEAYVTGSGYPAVRNSDVGQIRVAVPPVEEQRHIAQVLYQYDVVVHKYEEYLEHLMRLKKGLMQDLLTGEVRTKEVEMEVPEEVVAYG